MGMAASQARFLQLTARRTNIEYQGQQINQQRLALANASAGLFEKMLTLEVPTPPSSQDDKYYKQGYLFADSRDGIQKQITWETEEVNAITADELYTAIGDATTITITPSGVDGAGGTPIDISISALTGQSGTVTQAEAITAALDAIHNFDTSGGEHYIDTLPHGYTQVIRNVTIRHNIYTPDGQYGEIEETAPALLEFDNLNRLVNFTLLNKDAMSFADDAVGEDNEANSVGQGENLRFGGTFDDVAYANDMNEYEFRKAAYDFQVERINQETRQIQLQDKSLELKMKQLDTEHNAVQTEMDAVQKVIQKNIESSFKTFA